MLIFYEGLLLGEVFAMLFIKKVDRKGADCLVLLRTIHDSCYFLPSFVKRTKLLFLQEYNNINIILDTDIESSFPFNNLENNTLLQDYYLQL